MKFTIEAQRAIHEGGTKYYQAILIMDERRRACVITHWGAWHSGAECWPKHHGQRKLDFAESGGRSDYQRVISGKRKRGYREWEDSQRSTHHDLPALKAALGQILGSGDVVRVVDYFMPGSVASDIESDMATVGEFAAPPKVPSPATADHVEWGSW